MKEWARWVIGVTGWTLVIGAWYVRAPQEWKQALATYILALGAILMLRAFAYDKEEETDDATDEE